jgi:hypothetical protein
MSCRIDFTTPADHRLVLMPQGSRPSAVLYRRTTDAEWTLATGAEVQVAADEILEASVSFASLGLAANDPFAFFVSLQVGSNEVERHPAHRPIEAVVPDRSFEKLNWKA